MDQSVAFSNEIQKKSIIECAKLPDTLEAIPLNVDLTKLDESGRTPLHLAVTSVSIDEVKMLLDLKADINAVDGQGSTPLMDAVFNSKFDVSHLLIDAGCSVNTVDKSGNFPLGMAVRNQNLDLVELLLKKNADISLTDYKGLTSLHICVNKNAGDLEIAEALLRSEGANIEATSIDGNTPLHSACEGCGLDCWTDHLLIDRNSSRIPGFDDSIDSESMCQYLSLQTIDMIKLLLKFNADVLRRNARGETPLIRAAAFGCSHAVGILLTKMKPKDIDIKDHHGQTALIRAAQNHHPYVVKQLLVAGASVNCWDHRGYTALHAVLRGPFECMSTPIWNALCVNMSRAEWQWRDRKHMVVQVLVELGNADVNVCNWQKETPLDLVLKAEVLYLQQTIEFLCLHGAQRSKTIHDQETNRIYMVFGFDHKIKFIKTDRMGRTVLYYINTEWNYFKFLFGHSFIFDGFEVGEKLIPDALESGQKLLRSRSVYPHVIGIIKRCMKIADYRGRVPLHHLVSGFRQNPEATEACRHIVQIMKSDSNFNFNLTDNYGRTPMHYAIKEEFQDLIDHDADLTVTDVDGLTARNLWDICKLNSTTKKDGRWIRSMKTFLSGIEIIKKCQQIFKTQKHSKSSSAEFRNKKQSVENLEGVASQQRFNRHHTDLQRS